MVNVFKDNIFEQTSDDPWTLYPTYTLFAWDHALVTIFYFFFSLSQLVLVLHSKYPKLDDSSSVPAYSRLVQYRLIFLYFGQQIPQLLCYCLCPHSINSPHNSQRNLLKLKEPLSVSKSSIYFWTVILNQLWLGILLMSGDITPYHDLMIRTGKGDRTSS